MLLQFPRMPYLNRKLYDTQRNTHDSLQHAHFVFAGARGLGGGDGRAKPIHLRQLLGCGCHFDNFSGGSVAARHHHDHTGFTACAYHRVFSLYGMARDYYAGIVFDAAGTR